MKKHNRTTAVKAAEASQDATEVENMAQEFSTTLDNSKEAIDRIVGVPASTPETTDSEAEESIRAGDEENLERMICRSTEDAQHPQGVLNDPLPEDRFRVTARTIETIAIENLRSIEQIDDFIDAPDAVMPIVMRTPEGDFVVEGRNYITNALASGETSISCEVDVIAEHNMTELCLRKAGIRSQSRGGRARYAELVRNAMKLKQQLLSENSELRGYGHGGRRFGDDFSGDRDKDIVTILELRLGKSRNTVNTYLSHAEYVSNAVMATLIHGDKDKKFFESVQRVKRQPIERMQEEQKTSDEITAEISALVLRCIEEGFPAPSRAQRQTQSNPNPPQNGTLEGEDDETTDEENGDEHTPEPEPIDEDPVFVIKRSTLEVSSRLSHRIEASNDLVCLYNAVTEEIRALSAIATQIAGLTNPDFRQEREAA